jgi:tetratricopeptide (TPR) repeat protein
VDEPRPEDIGKVARNLRAESLFAHDAWATHGESVESESLGAVGPYRLLAAIGRGGLGVVYRAKAPDGRDVAVKVLRRPDSNDALLRFEREMKLLSLFGAREGFVPLLDRGESDRGPFLVMPLLVGGTLRDRLRAGPLGVEDAIALVRSIAQAVGRAHERGIVHRDLKPENVLFQDGKPLLADLGLAKHFGTQAGRGESLSRTGDLRGTLNYMAPEQARDTKSAGPRADVFSLGAILYECLAGRPAFEGDGVLPIVQKTEKGKLEPLSKVRSDVPRWLASVLERALAPDAVKRFEDGHAFARALVPDSRPRRRLLGALLAVAACCAVLAAALSSYRAREARRHVERPEAAHSANDRNGVIAEAVGLDPRAVALWKSGVARSDKNDQNGAIDDLTKAVALEPRFVAAWRDRGTARGRSGDYAGAIEDETRALELDPGNARAWYERGLVYLWRRECEKALADETRALEVDPSLARAWSARGSAWLEKGDADRAFSDANHAIELDPGFSDAWCVRGNARASRGDREGALADTTRAIELDPKVAVSWHARAVIEERAGDWAGVVADETRAIELKPELAEALVTRADAHLSRGDIDGAVADSSRAIAVSPRFALAYTVRADALTAKGDREGAIEDSTRAIELDPKLAAAWLIRGLARARVHDPLCEADLTRAIELDPSLAVAYAQRGQFRFDRGDRAGAAADLERYLELAPADPAAPQMRELLARARERAP